MGWVLDRWRVSGNQNYKLTTRNRRDKNSSRHILRPDPRLATQGRRPKRNRAMPAPDGLKHEGAPSSGWVDTYIKYTQLAKSSLTLFTCSVLYPTWVSQKSKNHQEKDG